MDVEAAQPRRLEHGQRQDQPVGRHHRGIEPEASKMRLFGYLAQADWRAHRQAALLGQGLHRRRARTLPATRRPRRLAIDVGDVVAGGDQASESGPGEIRRSHEGETHGRCRPRRQRR